MRAHHTEPVGPCRRELSTISLATNLDARYWMQALGVSRVQLEQAVDAVGTQVAEVMFFLRVPERRESAAD